MKIVVKTQNNEDVCDIEIENNGIISLTDCTLEDIETNDDMNEVYFLEVKLIKGELTE